MRRDPVACINMGEIYFSVLLSEVQTSLQAKFVSQMWYFGFDFRSPQEGSREVGGPEKHTPPLAVYTSFSTCFQGNKSKDC